MAKIQTQIPAARVPIADQDGLPTREWFRYFSDLYTFTGIGQGPTVCGQFLNTGTQTAAANTPTPVTYDTTSLSQGAAVGTVTSQIAIATTCLCNIAFSFQLANPSTTDEDDIWVWFRVNGDDIDSSASVVTVPKRHAGVDGTAILALNFFYQFTVGDYVELVWMTTTGNGRIYTLAASLSPARPASPGAIVTINQIDMSAP